MADDFESDFDTYAGKRTKAIVSPSPQKGDGDIENDFNSYAMKPAKAAPAPAKATKALENNPNDTLLTQGLKFGATSINKGLSHIPGFVGDQAGFADYLIARAHSAITGKPLEEVQADLAKRLTDYEGSATPVGKAASAIAPRNIMPGSQGIQNKLFDMTGEYKPESAIGNMGMAGIETVIGSAAPGMVGRGASLNPVQSAVQSAPITAPVGAVGQGVSDVTGDPLAGVAAGLSVPVAVAGGRRTGRAMIGELPPERAQLANAAVNQYGIPLGVGDLSNRLPVRMANSVAERLPFSGSQNAIDAKQGAFNSAVGRTFGENVTSITPEVMARARDRIGGDFNMVAAHTRIVPDQPLVTDFANIIRNSQLGPQGVEARIRANIAEIASRVQRQGGAIDGRTYQDLTRVGDPGSGRGAGIIQRLIRDPDPNTREAGQALRNALDDALQRQAPPDMIPVLQNARTEYRNMRTIEDLVAKNPEGNISPALLQGRVNAKSKGTHGSAYGGGGPLKELSDIGQAFLKQPGSSNTTERALTAAAMGMPMNLLAMATQNPMHAVMGGLSAVGTLGTGRAISSVMRNPNLGNNLINRSLGIPAVNNANPAFNFPVPYLPQQQIQYTQQQ